MRRFSNVCPTVLGKGGLPDPRRATSATRGGCLAVVTEYPKSAWWMKAKVHPSLM
jgi:hypothetical protein